MRAVLGLILGVGLGMVAGAALADDWVAVKLRGVVLTLQGGEWVRLARGEVVPDDRVVRTLGGRVTFVRGAETIELGPQTQIQIFDEARKKPFTTVKEYFGTVAVEAEVRDVQHFAVQTPYLVAVVKGTRFTVVSGDDDSTVAVKRGAVSVTSREDGSHTLVHVGQSATATDGVPLDVAGSGDLPVVLDAGGAPVDDSAAATASSEDDAGDDSDSSGKSNSGKGNSGNGNNGNGNGHSGDDGDSGEDDDSSGNNGNGNSGNGNNGNGNNGNGKDK